MRMLVQTAAHSLEEVIMCVQLFLAAAWQETLFITYRKQNGSVVKREVAPRRLWRSEEGRLLVDVWDLSRDDYRTFAVENFLGSAPSGHTDYFADLPPLETPAERVVREVQESVLDRLGFNVSDWQGTLNADDEGYGRVKLTHPTTKQELVVYGVKFNEDGSVRSSAVTEGHSILI